MPDVQLFSRDGPGADYEALHIVRDPASRLAAIIAVHRTIEGRAAGGIRRTLYADEAAALDDALRLASSMTAKCVLAELPSGGAKTVILDTPKMDHAAAYGRLGEAVEELGGRYLCGPDVGTSEEQLAHVREATAHVNPLGNDASASTARGVLAGIRAVLDHLDGDASFDGRRFAVQGLGQVGRAVAGGLVDGGGTVVGADPSPPAVAGAESLGVGLVEPDAITSEACDVFVPCALGGVLTEAVAAALPARAVCGSANDQLAAPEAGRLLHERGVVYAPDVVVNAGAAIEGVLTTVHGATDGVRARAGAQIDATHQRLAGILDEAAERELPPEEVARRRVAARLATGQS